MRTLGTTAAILSVVGAMGVGSVAPASADSYHRHHGYYGYHGYYNSGRACPRGFSLQGGNCAPYQGPRGPYAPPGSRYWWQ
jgi:hypothetical protein